MKTLRRAIPPLLRGGILFNNPVTFCFYQMGYPNRFSEDLSQPFKLFFVFSLSHFSVFSLSRTYSFVPRHICQQVSGTPKNLKIKNLKIKDLYHWLYLLYKITRNGVTKTRQHISHGLDRFSQELWNNWKNQEHHHHKPGRTVVCFHPGGGCQ